MNEMGGSRNRKEGVLTVWRRKCVSSLKFRRGYDLQNAGYGINRRYSRSKMSPVCHNFVQNAWKKDFCSNCFKSRDEHVKQEKPTTDSGKYFATPFQNRSSFFKTSKNPASILKIHPKKKSKRSVKFPEEVCSVIGYGGDDWSDDEEFQMSEDVDDDDVFPDTEEERELHKITKSNTDFNTVKANLLGDLTGEAKKSYTSLLLGKIQTDSDGKKKTLMVSVTPFGQENNKSNKIKSHARKPAVIPAINCSTENTSNGYKTNIILSSFAKNNDTVISTKYEKKEEMTETVCIEKSLLEEISETLEQNRISAVSDFKSQTQFSKPTVVDEQRKEDVTTESNEKRDTSEIKKNGLVRNSPIIKNQERPKLSLTGRPEFKFCKINIESTSVDSAVSALSSNTINSSFTSDDDSFSGRTDSDNDDSGNFTEPVNTNGDSHKIQIFHNIEKCTDSTDHSIEEIRKVDGQSDSLQEAYAPPYPTKILNMPPIIPKMAANEIFSVEASRELAGEPDGRADPDEPSEAPALPTSPVPTTVDARPSFLHGMISDLQIGRPSIPEKPKLPIKPLSVLKQTTTKRPLTTPPQQQQVIIQLQQTLNRSTKQEKEVIEQEDLTEELNNEITEIKEELPDTIYSSKPNLVKRESDGSINIAFNNKRKAPMPPPSPSSDEGASAKYQRNPTANIIKSDSPVVREMEKRERASSISPKSSPANLILKEEPTTKSYNVEIIPEPAPRRNISLSHDNLLLDDKRKGKLKFSIKKLLRIGSSKDLDKKELSTATISKLALKTEEIYDLTPKPKPRLVIIHPLELNGSSVEVVKTTELPETPRRLSHDNESIYSGNSSASDLEPIPQKVVNKPPPPPRTFSDDTKNNSPPKPARPPPPKSAALQKKQKQQTWVSSPPPARPDSNIYANLGEVRSAIAPRKPERTASMREREAQLELPKRRTPLSDEKDDDEVSQEDIVEATNDEVIHNYDDVYNSVKYEDSCTEDNNDSAKSSDSDYEYVNHARSSSPECDSGIKKTEEAPEARLNYGVKDNSFRKSAEDAGSEYIKYTNGMFNRSSSLPYCGSETESEIYSPYSFYSSADLDGSACNDDYGADVTSKNTTSKLRVRKGRSVVHKNLEDNYGAVVIANHEALAQVLEQIQQSATMQPSLRGLKACTNLRWSDFTLTQTTSLSPGGNKSQFVKSGKRLFYPAIWNSNTLGAVNVTLMLHKEQMASQIVSQQSVQPQTLSLNAVTEFCDLVPLQQFGEEGEDLVQATIVVLAHTQVDTIQSYGSSLHASESLNTKECTLIHSEQTHEATFMMLQLINGLKCLQARGIEEIPDTLTSFIILRESQSNMQASTANLQVSEDRLSSISAPKTNNYGRLCILQGLSEDINCNKSSEDEQLSSLCKCAISALDILLPGDKLNTLLKELLQNERAVSLNHAKAVLEFTLWGPLDVVQGVPVKERELSLQRWLDLDRATVLHGLVRTRVQLNAFEQLHLMFLVRSSAKAMCDASVLMEKANVY